MKVAEKIKLTIGMTTVCWLTTAILAYENHSGFLCGMLGIQTGLLVFQGLLLNKAKRHGF